MQRGGNGGETNDKILDTTYPVFGVVVFEDTTFMRRECSLIVEALYWLETSLHTNKSATGWCYGRA